MTAPYVIGVDIGGTNQTVAAAAMDGRLLGVGRCRLAPGGRAADVLANVVQLAEELGAARGRPARVGVGFGGPVDVAAGTVIASHHVPGWDGVPLRALLSTRLEAPVTLDNDANAAALGEAIFGAGRGQRHVLYVNIGTGIGGGIVLDGRVLHGAHGLAGEIGHLTVEVDGPRCDCGKAGCLEALASGRSLGRRARDAAAQDPAAAAPLIRLAGSAGALRGEHVVQAAAQQDPLALRLMDETAGYLGLALGHAANLLDPDVIVLGGGVSAAGEVLLAPLRAAVDRHLLPSLPRPPIVPAALGYDAGVVGAVALALQLE